MTQKISIFDPPAEKGSQILCGQCHSVLSGLKIGKRILETDMYQILKNGEALGQSECGKCGSISKICQPFAYSDIEETLMPLVRALLDENYSWRRIVWITTSEIEKTELKNPEWYFTLTHHHKLPRWLVCQLLEDRIFITEELETQFWLLSILRDEDIKVLTRKRIISSELLRKMRRHRSMLLSTVQGA